MTKKTLNNRSAKKEFHPLHFGKLKGMVVPDALPVQKDAPIVKKRTETRIDGCELFMQAVADVTPIHNKQGSKAASRDPRPAANPIPETATAAHPAEEIAQNLFLQEISRLKLDTTFADSVQDDGEMKPLSGNRLRQVKRGVVSVEYQLDLHGLNRDEALTALPRFLRSALQKGQKAVLIITGKGIHSADEPVLQRAVASWLRESGRELVLEFAPAPREMGGSGAFVVFLRSGQSGSG